LKLSGLLDFSGLSDDDKLARITSMSFILIGFVLVASIAADHYLIGVLLFAVPGILFLLAGSPVRILMMVFALQILLTFAQLSIFSIRISILNLRIDDMFTVLLIWLWILSLPDRSMRGIKIGVQGIIIVFFLVIFAFSAYRGLLSGNDTFYISNQLKPYGAYILYFPLLWILSDTGVYRRIWSVLLASAVIGGLVYLIKGYLSTGENVYLRATTGIRVATRQPNAMAAVLMMFIGRLWKDWKARPPLMVVILAILLMGGGILLSQTRGLWGGIILAMAAAWILNLFRKKDNIKLAKKLIVSLTVLAVLIILTVFTISALGILSASNIARRTGTETGNYLTDTSTLARIIAWSTIIDDLNGPVMIMGKGLGAVYTCFRPDIGGVVSVYYVDGSLFQIALNMGITGVTIFLSIFLISLFRSARLFIRTESRYRAGIALGVFCTVIMLLFASLFASVLTNYRYTMLWVFFLALLQVEIMKERKENTPSAA